MPLIQGKSDKSFSKNVSTEMNSGKPQGQSLAIAYSIKRRAKKKNMDKKEVDEGEGMKAVPMKKMAHGGMAEMSPKDLLHKKGVEWLPKFAQSNEDLPEPEEPKMTYVVEAGDFREMAEGGEVNDEVLEDDTDIDEERDEEAKSILGGTDRIVKHVMSKRMADGGTVKPDEDKTKIAQDSMRKAFHFAQGGYLQPEYDYMAENDSYPDVDEEEHDVLDYDVDDPKNKVAKRKEMLKKIFSR